MGQIHVALATDRRCVWGAAVTMRTIADHNDLADSLHFHVFTSGLTPAAEEGLRRTAESLGHGATIRLVEFDARPVTHLLRSKVITHTAYAALFLGELVPMEVGRCIYVDCDLI
ncbi:MAG: glycosyltransferase, partial [Longimicrobiales bacterium]